MARELLPQVDLDRTGTVTHAQAAATRRLVIAHARRHAWPASDRTTVLAILGIDTPPAA